MLKTLLVGTTLTILGAGAAIAQQSTMPPEHSVTNGGAGIRSNNITATGETVPNPGASQSAGTTAMDRGIQEEDNKIQRSICKGC